MMYFPTKWGAKELQKPQNQNHVVVMESNFTHHSGWNVYTTKQIPGFTRDRASLDLVWKIFFENFAQEIPQTFENFPPTQNH